MQHFLEQPTGDDPTVMIAKLEQLNTYLARSGYLLAEAKKMRNEHIKFSFDTKGSEIKSYPPSVVKSLIGAFTSKDSYYVDWLDRLNSSAVHIGDNLRTQISYSKEELRLTKSGY